MSSNTSAPQSTQQEAAPRYSATGAPPAYASLSHKTLSDDEKALVQMTEKARPVTQSKSAKTANARSPYQAKADAAMAKAFYFSMR